MTGCLYAIFDVVAHEAGPVFNAKNDDVAVRQYVYLLRGDANSRVNNPEDFHLYRVGIIDTESMVVTPDREQIPIDFKKMVEEF